MIPKKIHYCWFGNGPKSELIHKCMLSWEKFFPEYEIIEWNESNFDIGSNAYCREAYEQKKWAFVSDYVRLAVIYQYGGIYFDTDVEVLRRFDDLLKDYGYLCFEHTSYDPLQNYVSTGLGFAAEAGSHVIGSMLREYDDLHFLKDGKMNLTACPIINTAALLKLGLKQDGSMQVVGDIRVYPFEYFCGTDLANAHPHITENTYTVHHYAASWKKISPFTKFRYGVIVRFLQFLMGYSRYDRLIAFKEKLKNRKRKSR